MAERSDASTVVFAFEHRINTRDLEGLLALMTHDHVFIDRDGQRVSGAAALRDAWAQFFEIWPDYQIVVMEAVERVGAALLVGHSRCSEPTLAGPAIWAAQVRDGLVAQWRVWVDGPEARSALGFGAA